jgi:hypothetical protein
MLTLLLGSSCAGRACELVLWDPERIRPVAYMHPGNSPAELIDQVKDLIGRGVLAINLPGPSRSATS